MPTNKTKRHVKTVKHKTPKVVEPAIETHTIVQVNAHSESFRGESEFQFLVLEVAKDRLRNLHAPFKVGKPIPMVKRAKNSPTVEAPTFTLSLEETRDLALTLCRLAGVRNSDSIHTSLLEKKLEEAVEQNKLLLSIVDRLSGVRSVR